MEAKTKTQTQRMVLEHRSVTGESGCGRVGGVAGDDGLYLKNCDATQTREVISK